MTYRLFVEQSRVDSSPDDHCIRICLTSETCSLKPVIYLLSCHCRYADDSCVFKIGGNRGMNMHIDDADPIFISFVAKQPCRQRQELQGQVKQCAADLHSALPRLDE